MLLPNVHEHHMICNKPLHANKRTVHEEYVALRPLQGMLCYNVGVIHLAQNTYEHQDKSSSFCILIISCTCLLHLPHIWISSSKKKCQNTGNLCPSTNTHQRKYNTAICLRIFLLSTPKTPNGTVVTLDELYCRNNRLFPHNYAWYAGWWHVQS